MADETAGPGRRRTIRIAALAAVAGAVVGVAAVAGIYGMGGAGGNAAARCQPTHAAALKPFVKGEVAALIPATEPVDVADLAFTGPDGKPATLAGKAGKVVLLNLWATWCAPCRAEMPALDRLEAAHGGPGFEVVAVNLDTKDDGRDAAFLKEIGVGKLALYHDRTMGLFQTLKGRGRAVGLPTTILVGPDGCELGTMHGPAEWDSADGVALVDAAVEATGAGKPGG